MAGIKADFGGALRKTQVLARIPKATKYQATLWGSDTLRMLKERARSMQKAGKGRKTGQLARNVGMEVSANPERWQILLGTGVGRTLQVKYARIQDQGGAIKMKDKMLTIPLGSTKGLIRNFPGGFFFKSRAGNLIYAMRSGKGKRARIKPLFVLKDQVTLPATHWFSGIVSARKADLGEMMKPGTVLRVAEGMVGGGK